MTTTEEIPTGNEGTKQLAFNSEHRLRSENLAFDIDVWAPIFLNHNYEESYGNNYPASVVKPLTARSVFVPLTFKEAQAIRAFHDVSWRNSRSPPMLTLEETQILKKLEQDLDDTLKKNFSSTSSSPCAFVRLCGRSPKDGDPRDFSRIRKEYEFAVKSILASQSPGSTDQASNQDINIYQVDPLIKLQAIARINPLRVTSGQDILQLLLTSERVYADMLDWTKYGEPEQIVLREYNPEVRLDYEFRLFICHGKVTAISQYDHHAYYPHLDSTLSESNAQHIQELKEGLLTCWQVVHRVLTGTSNEATMSYVADIAYLPQSKKYVLLEISPFSPCTGAALFSWSHDRLLMEGKSDDPDMQYPVFRLKKKDDLHSQLNDLIQWNWEDRWYNPQRESLPYEEYFYDPNTHDDNEDDGKKIKKTRVSNQTSFWSRLMCILGGGGNDTIDTDIIVTPATTSNPVAEDTSPAATSSNEAPTLLFVYGTLKTGFQWNSKYLSPRLGASYIGHAQTITRFPLVIGDCGVPYLLGDVPNVEGVEGKQQHWILGELWSVNAEALRGLDDYEGLGKGIIAVELLMCGDFMIMLMMFYCEVTICCFSSTPARGEWRIHDTIRRRRSAISRLSFDSKNLAPWTVVV